MSALATFHVRRKLWWAQLAPREQRLATVALTLVVLALLWWVALAPALRTLADAPAAHAQLDAQLQQMSTLQAQARQLQTQPRVPRDDALRALEGAVRDGLPNAQLQVAGASEGATVTVRSTAPDALAQWLAQARANARAVPREVHLTRSQALPVAPTSPRPAALPAGRPAAAPTLALAATPAEASATPAAPRWDGTLVMSLPAR
ncbi:type II secretion system protein GspM [Variovorax ginsengisoli]|uniref:General secretion pathway protein M n=1 Tax=Variovorax ginsengisoli TaxID=363844 RepID=A0ABT9S8A0_9BURK|nr:type II secretion system protein GspM [Variovorax ginsengisoli]MDP9900581.1 general secretion pathway protein M [Variovorax ginsengisoli]